MLTLEDMIRSGKAKFEEDRAAAEAKAAALAETNRQAALANWRAFFDAVMKTLPDPLLRYVRGDMPHDFTADTLEFDAEVYTDCTAPLVVRMRRRDSGQGGWFEAEAERGGGRYAVRVLSYCTYTDDDGTTHYYYALNNTSPSWPVSEIDRALFVAAGAEEERVAKGTQKPASRYHGEHAEPHVVVVRF